MDALGADTLWPLARDAQHDEAARVRNVEGDPARNRVRVDDLRSAIRVFLEAPILRRHSSVSRQYRAHERSSDQVSMPVMSEVKASLFLSLLLDQQPTIVREHALVCDLVAEGQPQLDLVRGQGQHLPPRG